MKKIKEEYDESLDIPSSFSEVFYSMEDELLIEMALIYPQQLRDLCVFLCLDYQMAEEEIQFRSVRYKD
jgi:hypothetical protein